MYSKEILDIRWRLLVFFILFGILLVGTIALRPFVGELLGISSREIDELPEFDRRVLESLREGRRVSVED